MATQARKQITKPAAKAATTKPAAAATTKVTPPVLDQMASKTYHAATATNTASGDTPGDVLEHAGDVNINLGVHAGDGDAVVEVDSEEMVTVIVPKAFTLTLDTGKPIPYGVGTQEMPLSHATHWWARAQGVTIYKK